MKPINQIVTRFSESVFTTLTQMANRHGAINLAQGFPDDEGPQWVKDLGIQALQEGKHQYAPSMGAPALRQALSQTYQAQYGLTLDPNHQILVTVGASEAIFCSILALCNPGDEFLCFEPLYDSYVASAQLAQAQIRPVALPFEGLAVDFAALKAKITPRTKLLMLNNPHNPTGKVFTPSELEGLATLAQEHDLYVISDEVYEYLTFDQPHLPIAKLPGMAERTLTISSMGKTFGLTGWKIGWVIGSPELIKAVHHVHQFVPFCISHPLQLALAEALPRLPEYLPTFRLEYRQKRDLLVSGLRELGYEVSNPQGTYFALARLPLGRQDLEFCQELIETKKVATIPLSSFYLESQEGKSLIRFCFAKQEATLRQALQNLQKS